MSLLTKEELEVRLEQIQQEKIDVIRKKQRAWERGELSIILGSKRQQRTRKSLGARKILLIVLE